MPQSEPPVCGHRNDATGPDSTVCAWPMDWGQQGQAKHVSEIRLHHSNMQTRGLGLIGLIKRFSPKTSTSLFFATTVALLPARVTQPERATAAAYGGRSGYAPS